LRRLLRSLSVALALLLGSLPKSASAGSYRNALAHGVEARDRAEQTANPEDWRDALEAFDEAGQLQLTKEARFEFAGAAAQLHFDDEACVAYEEALGLGLNGKAAEIAQSFVVAHRPTLAALDVTGPRGATLLIRQRERATLPLRQPLLVVAGSVVLHLEAPGFQAFERSIILDPGTTSQISVTMVSIMPPKSDQSGEAARPSSTERASEHAKASPSFRTWGVPVAIAGGALTALGVTTIIVTSAMLSSEQSTLDRDCTVRQGDACLKTSANKQAAAQAAADHILTERALRWAAVGGSLAGVGALTVGLIRVMSVERKSVAAHASLRITPNELGFALYGSF
jgi:hypothetical protein